MPAAAVTGPWLNIDGEPGEAPRPAAGRTPAAPAEAAPPLESRVGLHWLNRIGVVTLTLGVAFAFKTAVDNNWIGPTARILLGLALALVSLASGHVLRRRGQVVFAQGLTGLGVSLLYLSFWASFGLYRLLPQEAAFGLMVATTGGAAALAMHYRARAIAILAMIGGYLTPIVLSTGGGNTLIFFSYLALLNLGGMTMARRRAWPVLEYLAAIATCVLYIGWSTSALPEDRLLATVFVLVWYVQLAIAPLRLLWVGAQLLVPVAVAAWWLGSPALVPLMIVLAVAGLAVADRRQFVEAPLWSAVWAWGPIAVAASAHGATSAGVSLVGSTAMFAVLYGWLVHAHVRRKRGFHGLDLALVVVNPALFLASALVVLEPDHHRYLGAVLAALAIAQFALARLIWNPAGGASRDALPGTLALAIALACVTVAVPVQLTGVHITIAWVCEGCILAWLAGRFASTKLDVAACAVLGLAIVRLATVDIGLDRVALALPLFANDRFIACAVLAAGLFVSQRSFRAPRQAVVAYVLAHVIVVLALGLELAGWIERADSEARRLGSLTVAISILIAVYAVILIALGVVRRRARDRILGLAFMAIVVGKLYLSDVWTVGRAFQVIAFLGLGALLLLVSYLYSRYRSLIERLWKPDEAASGSEPVP